MQFVISISFGLLFLYFFFTLLFRIASAKLKSRLLNHKVSRFFTNCRLVLNLLWVNSCKVFIQNFNSRRIICQKKIAQEQI